MVVVSTMWIHFAIKAINLRNILLKVVVSTGINNPNSNIFQKIIPISRLYSKEQKESKH